MSELLCRLLGPYLATTLVHHIHPDRPCNVSQGKFVLPLAPDTHSPGDDLWDACTGDKYNLADAADGEQLTHLGAALADNPDFVSASAL